MERIQGKKHKMGAYEINKISLSCFDDKRFVLDHGIHTLAYFYKDLKNRFSQITIKKRFKKILTKKKRFSQIRKIQKDSRKKKRFSQMIANKNKCVEINF